MIVLSFPRVFVRIDLLLVLIVVFIPSIVSLVLVLSKYRFFSTAFTVPSRRFISLLMPCFG